MAVYGNTILKESTINNVNYEVLEEGFFLSGKGKDLKKKIKEILKESRANVKYLDAVKAGFKQKYDQQQINKCINEISKLFKVMGSTNVIIETTTYEYGTVTEYIQYFLAISGEKLYSFCLTYSNKGGWIRSFSEIDMDKFRYPVDVVEFGIKNWNPHFDMRFTKNGISAQAIGGLGTSLAADKDLFDKIEKFIEQKYKGAYTCKVNKLSGNMKITKSKSTNESVEFVEEDEMNFDDDMCLAEYFIIKEEVFNEAAYKPLHKIDQDDLAKGGSHLAGLWKKEIENMKSQDKEKMISKYLYTMYYAIVGQSFYTEVPAIRKGENIKYNPKYSQYWSLCKTYMNGKHKAKILKDVEKTMDAAEQYVEKNNTPENKVMIAYYNAYINDLKHIK